MRNADGTIALRERRLDQRGRRQDARRRHRPARPTATCRTATSGTPRWTAPGPRATSSPRSPASRSEEYVGNFYTRDLYLRWKTNADLQREQGRLERHADQNCLRTGYKDELPDGGKCDAAARLQPARRQLHDLDLSATYTGFKNTTIDGRHPEPVRPRSAVHRAQRRRSRRRRLGSARGRPAWPFAELRRQVQVLLIDSALQRRPV